MILYVVLAGVGAIIRGVMIGNPLVAAVGLAVLIAAGGWILGRQRRQRREL
jgi:LPXTG-motif cell wall-anchored protein